MGQRSLTQPRPLLHWVSRNRTEATHSPTHPFESCKLKWNRRQKPLTHPVTLGKWKWGRSHSLNHPPFHIGQVETGHQKQKLPTRPPTLSHWVSRNGTEAAHPPLQIRRAEMGQKPLTHPPTPSHHASRNGTEAAHHSPQPRTPRPLIMVVWESVPTTLSGYSSPPSLKVTRARYSRFTWCTMPDPGGTISMFCRDWAPH